LIRNGASANQAQLWLGHHDPGFTARTYVHLDADDLPDPAIFDSYFNLEMAESANPSVRKGVVGEHPRYDRENEHDDRVDHHELRPAGKPRHGKSVLSGAEGGNTGATRPTDTARTGEVREALG
jgi:hypothetical protein